MILASSCRRIAVWFVLLTGSLSAFASAYDAHPKLVVILVIDQFRGDYLDRVHDQLGPSGFRMLMEHGAYFTNCFYEYANTRTAPGHATLATGSYTDGHGILANEWWDSTKRKMVTSVEDDRTALVGSSSGIGASPKNLQSDTIGDELKLATQGKARVFAISLKDRSSVLPGGFSANGAYWIEHRSGAWQTSTYYVSALPDWVQKFNSAERAAKYWNQDWKDAAGKVLRSTTRAANSDFYDVVGSTPFANDYEFDFARELITSEKLGTGPATDMLVLSLSANDILGHKVGPDAPEMPAMALALDREFADFFTFLDKQLGLSNVWIALSADHGVAPAPVVASGYRLPAQKVSNKDVQAKLEDILSARLGPGKHIASVDWPVVFLDPTSFDGAKVSESDAEKAVGEALKQVGMRSYFTRSELESNQVPPDEFGRRFLHSYSSIAGWYVLGIAPPFVLAAPDATDHASPYNYDRHVPLAFYGQPFRPGVYRSESQPVDLAATLASLLGINPPAAAVGRVLTEALAAPEQNTARHGTIIPANHDRGEVRR